MKGGSITEFGGIAKENVKNKNHFSSQGSYSPQNGSG
jgi:hypothetical protein